MNSRDKNELAGTGMIPLRVCLVDWITITSYEPKAYAGFENVLVEVSNGRWDGSKEQHKIHVYEGHALPIPGEGWSFLGIGKQGKKDNVMLRVSGALANKVFEHGYIQSVLIADIAKASRIDLQVTVIEPQGWSQWGLMKDMKERGHNVEWKHSYDKIARRELATIYHGSRHSERMTRLYEKLSLSGDVLLRFETEYKGARAKQIAKGLCGEMKGKGWQYLAYEMKAFKDDRVDKAMQGVLLADAAVTERIVRERGIDTTYEWVKGVCMPVIDRYLKQHDNKGQQIADILITMLVNRAESIGAMEKDE